MHRFSGILPHVGLAALLAGLTSGCGNGAPPVDTSHAEATVTGKVTIRGKPATGGKIAFDPANIGRKDAMMAVADIKPDGSYSVKTLVGLNQVTFSGPQFLKEQAIQDSRFQFNANAGENTFDPDLPPKANP